MKPGSGVGIITLGTVTINTMPVWVGALGRYPAVGDGLAGVFASLILFSAALACAGMLQSAVSSLSRYALPLSLSALALGENWPVIPLAAASICLGVAMGNLTQQALRALAKTPNSLASISLAMSIGLLVSLVFYLLLPIADLSPFSILFFLSLPTVFLGAPLAGGNAAHLSTRVFQLPVRFIGFFVMMGAYWTFLELYGARFNNSDAVTLWLLASLISGAGGSIFAARLSKANQDRAQKIGMLLAAATGAASYVAQDMSVFGISILANAFTLFLFFPLYLQSAGSSMPHAMAGYLLGFSAGGVVGAALLQIGGYQLLALTVLLSGLIGLLPQVRRTDPQ